MPADAPAGGDPAPGRGASRGGARRGRPRSARRTTGCEAATRLHRSDDGHLDAAELRRRPHDLDGRGRRRSAVGGHAAALPGDGAVAWRRGKTHDFVLVLDADADGDAPPDPDARLDRHRGGLAERLPGAARRGGGAGRPARVRRDAGADQRRRRHGRRGDDVAARARRPGPQLRLPLRVDPRPVLRRPGGRRGRPAAADGRRGAASSPSACSPTARS